MPERRAHEGDESANVAFMIMSSKKRVRDRLDHFRKGIPVCYGEQNMRKEDNKAFGMVEGTPGLP